MTNQDIAIGALCAYRENRQFGQQGLQSILNVLQNRAAKRGSNVYTEATRKGKFSSISTPGDPELDLWPVESDPQWRIALALAAQEPLADITNGSTLYYAPKGMAADDVVPYTLPDGTKTVFPKRWDQTKVIYQCEIGQQLFFREK